MSREKKVLTENPVIDELIYNGQVMMHGCILKDQDEADKYETFESIKQSDFYILVKENRVGFKSFDYDEKLLSKLGVFTDEEIYIYSNNKSLIPKEYRNDLLTLAREDFIDNYVELNDYYRMLNGQPPLEVGSLFIDYDDLDGKNGNVWKIVRSQAKLPIHEWEDSYILALNETGYLDSIIENHPELKYLNFLGEKRISIYSARKAERFECIYLPECKSSDVQTHFFQLLDKNRTVFLRTLYTEAYKFDSDYYDKFIIIMIILQSFCDLISEYAYYIIRRDIFDIRTIRYLFEANGVKFFEDIPMKYQLTLVRNLNRLVKYKSTDRNIIDICSLFGFRSIALFKYYILKDRKMLSDDEYKYIKTVSETWTECIVPEFKFTSIAYGNCKYVAVASGNSYYAISEDLRTWNTYQFTGGISDGWDRITFADGKFFVISSTRLLYTENLTYWNNVELPKPFPNTRYYDVVYKQFKCIAISNNCVAYSTDLKKWNTNLLGKEEEVTKIVNYDKGYKEVTKTDPAGNITSIVTTDYIENLDGTFTEVVTTQPIMNLTVIQLIFDGEKFVALTSDGFYTSLYGDRSWEHTYFKSMKFPEGYSLNSLSQYSNTSFAYANNEYHFLRDNKIYSSSDLVNWRVSIITGASKDGNNYFRFANNRFVVLDNNIKKIFMSRDLVTWKSFALDSNVKYKAIGYGNMKFVVLPSDGRNREGYYYDCNSQFTETSDDDFDEITKYNNDENYRLRFIKTPLQGDLLEAISNPTNHYDYYSIIGEDKYWEGDKDRDTVRKEIIDHEFNILRTKYYSIENIVEFSEITFQLGYFMNMIMNYDIADQLTISLPFIPGNSTFPIIDVFVFLYALGYEYYGLKGDIITETSGVLTIRSFNFEADLNKLAESLYDEHQDKYYDLTEMCGGRVFAAPQTSVLTYKELMYIYNNNREIYEYVTKQMIHCSCKNIYTIYKKIYDALFVAKLNLENFSVLDSQGEIIYTYKTYMEYLNAKQFSMYSYIQYEIKPLNEKEKKNFIGDVMNNVISYIEDTTSLMDTGQLDYIWHGVPTIDMDFIKNYIIEVVKFFKSFKADFMDNGTLYKMCDKFDNMIWVIDALHIDHRFDWADFFRIYENIDMNVAMTEKDKIGIKEYIIKIITYAAKVLGPYSEKFNEAIREIYYLFIHLDMYDKIEINDVIVKIRSYFNKEDDIYWFEKMYRTYTYTKEDQVSITSSIKLQAFWISDEYDVTLGVPLFYTDK